MAGHASQQSASNQGAPQAKGLEQAHSIVGRGMLALVLSQVVTTPVSMVVQALLARNLGAGPFGAIYFATAVLGVWYLFVEWGGHAQIAAAVARDHRSAARLFASGVVTRVALAAIVLVAIPPFARWMEYDETQRLALTLVSLRLALQALGTLCIAVVRGLERVHWVARATLFANLTDAVFVVAALLGGGGLQGVLVAQVAAPALALVVQVGMVRRLTGGPWTPDMASVLGLLTGGFSFMVLDVVVRLQPYIDATFLESLAPSEALGWHSAASRVAGVLVFPALTLNFALYPTLARLWVTDRESYNALVRLGLRTVAVIGILAATGTALFAPAAIRWIYGDGFSPAGQSLSVMSMFILLVYVSIVIGPSTSAAGRQWYWTAAQSLCLIVSVVLDPILIPWAQERFGNGSLGVSIAVGLAETAMVTLGLLVLPAGVLSRALGRTVLRCALAAAAAATVGLALRGWPVLAIPATILVYLVVVAKFGELDSELLSVAPPWLSDAVRPWLARMS